MADVRRAAHEVRGRLTVVRLELQLAGRDGKIRGDLVAYLVEQVDRAAAAVDALLEDDRPTRPTRATRREGPPSPRGAGGASSLRVVGC